MSSASTTSTTTVKKLPKSLNVENPDPQALKEWNNFLVRAENAKSRYLANKGQEKKKKTADTKTLSSPNFTPGPDVYMADYVHTGWSSTASEWTDESITGAVETYEDTGFGMHVSGMRVHAQTDSTIIEVTDGSVPLQFYTQGYNDNTDFNSDAITIAEKFNAAFYYIATNDISFDKVVITILAVDSANAATKTRLDFYKIYDADSVIAIQVIIENLDMETYRDTRVRFNLSTLEISENGASGSVTIYANRIPNQTVGDFDTKQSYNWYVEGNSFEGGISYDDSGGHNFKGWTFYRRVPYTALRLSNFYPTDSITTEHHHHHNDSLTTAQWIALIATFVFITIFIWWYTQKK
jgi:hypothetical protein